VPHRSPREVRLPAYRSTKCRYGPLCRTDWTTAAWICGRFLSPGLRELCTTPRSGAGEGDIERIRREFEDAKRNFPTILSALKDMPKMNPQGLQ
jgi:hypothetical protein